MSKSNSLENSWLLLLFNNTNIANVGDATGLRASTTAGSLFFSLHTADPGEGGDQTSNEVSYTGYARVGVARSGAGFVVTGNSVSPAANVVFGVSSSGTPTITHFGLGTASSGAGVLLYRGPISPQIIVVVGGNAPTLTTATAITED